MASSQEMDATTRTTFFPSLGFYGAKNVDRLVVPLPPDLVRLRLELPRKPREVLDVKQVELVAGERVLNIPASAVRASISSFASARVPDAAAPLVARTPLTTRREPGPWWEVTLLEPLGATALRVYNRRDMLGRRTRALVVRARTVSGGETWHDLRRLRRDDLRDATALVERLTGISLRTPRWLRVTRWARPPRAAWARRKRTVVLGRLVAQAAGPGLGPLTREELRLLLALVPTAPRGTGPALTELETRLLAALLVAQRVTVPGTATSIRSFGDVLPDRAALRALTVEINAFAARAALTPQVITRHGLRDVGALRADADSHVELMARLEEVFAELGHPLVMAYGTLLGAVREGHFLEHDDDVDMLFPLEAVDADAARPLLADLQGRLRERGYGIWRNPTGLNFHVTDRATGRHVDAFPYLVDGDRATLHMTSMRLETLDLDVLEPAGRRELLGRSVPVPHRPERFLEERYGPGWRVEDPYHDWTWPLSS